MAGLYLEIFYWGWGVGGGGIVVCFAFLPQTKNEGTKNYATKPFLRRGEKGVGQFPSMWCSSILACANVNYIIGSIVLMF